MTDTTPLITGVDFVCIPAEDDVATARERLEAKGVQFVGDTFDSGVCWQAICLDPDGNPLSLHHRYAPKGDLEPPPPAPA